MASGSDPIPVIRDPDSRNPPLRSLASVEDRGGASNQPAAFSARCRRARGGAFLLCLCLVPQRYHEGKSGAQEEMGITFLDNNSNKNKKKQSIGHDGDGGGDGIGLALSKAVLEVGGHVAVIGLDREPKQEFVEIRKQATVDGRQMRYYSADVTDHDALRIAFDQILENFGRVDGIIACAGICVEKPFLKHTREDVHRLYEVNSIGLFFSVQFACRAMMQNDLEGRQSRGSVVMIGSIASDCALEEQGLSAYSSSKGAVKGLLNSLAVEMAPLGIRVNMITPGHTVTNMSVAQWKTRPELEGVMKTAIPMGRMGHRRDLKGAAAYFLSDASLYTTGSELIISGGLHAGRL